VKAWETLFLHLESTLPSKAKAKDVEAEAEEIARTRCENEVPFGVTPMKKQGKVMVYSPALEAGFETTLMALI
jgi:hypothetical protein